jgi:hypothetical protein
MADPLDLDDAIRALGACSSPTTQTPQQRYDNAAIVRQRLEELAAALRASRTAVPVPPPFDPDVTLIGNREGNQREVRIYQRDAQRQSLDLDAAIRVISTT